MDWKALKSTRKDFWSFNPFDTKRYAQNEGFYVLTDGHVMKPTAIAFDLELMKLLEVRGLPG